MPRLLAALVAGLVALSLSAQPPKAEPKKKAKAKPPPPSTKTAEDVLKVGPRPKKPPLPPSALPLKFVAGERIALVGNSTAERMGLFGHFETMLHLRHPDLKLVVRNFGFPADEVGIRQRSADYTHLDDPLYAFNPDTFLCFFGFNESFKGPDGVAKFQADYEKFLDEYAAKYPRDDAKSPPRFVLVSPIAFEPSGDPLQPKGETENAHLKLYADAVKAVAGKRTLAFVDLFTPTQIGFAHRMGLKLTIDGCHLNEYGDRAVAGSLDAILGGNDGKQRQAGTSGYEKLRAAVNDKSWVHAQDHRMVNGWYVYGGRRTFDTETFPREYAKLRNMAAVRDQRVWDLAAGKQVGPVDDSKTGELIVPPTRFGVPQQKYSENAEGGPRIQPPADLIKSCTLAPGLGMKLFASEEMFPELAKPVQINFDSKGRLWVACMPNYPQWKPGDPPANDRLLILEDTNGDGVADKCTTFYDKLHCPTGFEFFDGGVLVMSQPRILFLKDTDGDDKADQVTHLLDGWATDDTHHRGGWEWGPTGRLHILEGIATSTTLETPWGPHRSQGAGGCYQYDPRTRKIRQFALPGMANMWCYHFDEWGQGFVGDGTTPNQSWDTPLSGGQYPGRKGHKFLFDGSKGERPNLGSERLVSRALPDAMQGQFVYACVINLNGIPRFTLTDDGAGFKGARVKGPDGQHSDLVRTDDKHFRPADPQVGPDGALWFGDWSNPLIGHMQYSQRDPNRDHVHGRIYRVFATDKPLVKPVTQHGKGVPEILEQFREYEWRTRYRARRELAQNRPASEVLPAVDAWVKALTVGAGYVPPERVREYDRLRCEAMWVQAGHHAVDPKLVESLLKAVTPEARAAAVHLLADERDRLPGAFDQIAAAANDTHPRVRAEAVRGLSFYQTPEAAAALVKVANGPMDYWLKYTVETALAATEPAWRQGFLNGSLVKDAPNARSLLAEVLATSKAGGAAAPFLQILLDPNAKSPDVRLKAMQSLARMRGNEAKGQEVYARNCTACHRIGTGPGQDYGPNLAGVMTRTKGAGKPKLIEHILDPNAEVEDKYLTTKVETIDGKTLTGLLVGDTADRVELFDGKDKVSVPKADIDRRTVLKQSSMPEGLAGTMSPAEFLDLIEYLGSLRQAEPEPKPKPPQNAQWLHLPGPGPKVVLVSGDEEYRSEEALPQLAKILNKHHGFDCTVLFAIDPKDGTINPYALDSLPGLEKLATADLVVLSIRMRQLKDADAKHLIDYAESGKPLVALRTSTHPLALKPDSAYAKYTWTSKVPGFEGGFGRKYLGETWVAHHGQHGKEGTRGVPAPGQESHPVLRGIGTGEVFGPTDVYTANPPADFTRVLLGQVTKTLAYDSPPVEGKKNDPMQPVAWVKGKTFVTTLGASQDLTYEGTRRLIVNGCLWALGKDVPAKANVDLVGDYKPTAFKFKGHKPGVKPEDLR